MTAENQSNYCDQSQEEQTIQLTDQNYYPLPVTSSESEENNVHKVRFVLLFIGSKNWHEILKPITKCSNRNSLISFVVHLKPDLIEGSKTILAIPQCVLSGHC